MDMARGRGFTEKAVAVMGDSTFVHSGITSLIDIVYNKGTTTTVILDNDTTGMTGHQQNPSTGLTIRDEETVRLDLLKLCEAIGVPSVREADAFDVVGLEKAIKEELSKECASVIIVRRPCALLKIYVPDSNSLCIDMDKCTSCKMCMKISCAAIVDKDGNLVINDALCVRCGLCLKICKFGAIVEAT
jgi:indolepyruvate ferredoxin oxidoreductase alpha subunit